VQSRCVECLRLFGRIANKSFYVVKQLNIRVLDSQEGDDLHVCKWFGTQQRRAMLCNCFFKIVNVRDLLNATVVDLVRSSVCVHNVPVGGTVLGL
jgi:hypothetical protein